eukprot:scaffold136756_cov20-Tisochrysis_lutea.AAC.1
MNTAETLSHLECSHLVPAKRQAWNVGHCALHAHDAAAQELAQQQQSRSAVCKRDGGRMPWKVTVNMQSTRSLAGRTQQGNSEYIRLIFQPVILGERGAGAPDPEDHPDCPGASASRCPGAASVLLRVVCRTCARDRGANGPVERLLFKF